MSATVTPMRCAYSGMKSAYLAYTRWPVTRVEGLPSPDEPAAANAAATAAATAGVPLLAAEPVEARVGVAAGVLSPGARVELETFGLTVGVGA